MDVTDIVTTARTPPRPPPDRRGAAAAGFERIYRAQFATVTAFFARRTADPQTVADLTADTFVQAITSFATFDPAKGTDRAWLLGIARRVFARHCDAHSRRQEGVRQLAGLRPLGQDHIEELVERIDAEATGRALRAGLAALPESDRDLIELVDLAGLRPKEAAAVLGLSPGATRIRLLRARRKLKDWTGKNA